MPASALITRVLPAATFIIAILVAAQFVTPPALPWLARQFILAAIGIGGVVLAEVFLFGTTARELPFRLGLGAPNLSAVVFSLVVALPMWMFLPVADMLGFGQARLAANWAEILFGVFLVNGLAEEIIHRAFVFGRAREHWPFLRAASFSALVFGAQHVYLVFTLGASGGMASVVLALLLAFPLARLFQSGSHSIAGPAIAHTSSNASFLILANSDEIALLLAHMVVVLGSFYLWFWLDNGVVRRLEVA